MEERKGEDKPIHRRRCFDPHVRTQAVGDKTANVVTDDVIIKGRLSWEVQKKRSDELCEWNIC